MKIINTNTIKNLIKNPSIIVSRTSINDMDIAELRIKDGNQHTKVSDITKELRITVDLIRNAGFKVIPMSKRFIIMK